MVRLSEGEGWSLRGLVRRSGTAPWGDPEREIHITGGSGTLGDVDDRTFDVENAFSTEVGVVAGVYGYGYGHLV